MRRPPLPNNVATWTLFGNVHGVTRWQIVSHVALSPVGVPSPSDLSAVHGDLSTFALNLIGPMMSTDADLSLSRLTYNGPTGLVRDDARIDAPGLGSGLAVLSACAGITWQTGELGRGRFGRTFVPGLPSSSYTEGYLLLDPPASSWQTGINDFLASVNAITTAAFSVVTFVLLHRRQNEAWLDHAYVTPVIGGRLNPSVTSQVRRLKHANVA